MYKHQTKNVKELGTKMKKRLDRKFGRFLLEHGYYSYRIVKAE